MGTTDTSAFSDSNWICFQLKIHEMVIEIKMKMIPISSFLPLGFSGQRGVVVACICPSVRPPVHKPYFAHMITRHIFELESLNLWQICILWYSQLVLKIGAIDLDLQGHFGHLDLEFLEIQLIRKITRHRFGMEWPICTKHAHWDTLVWYWKWGSLTMTFKVTLAILT